MMGWGGETPASDAKRLTKKWRLRAVLLVEARSDSYAGVIYGVLCKVSVRLVNADQKIEQKIKNPQEVW